MLYKYELCELDDKFLVRRSLFGKFNIQYLVHNSYYDEYSWLSNPIVNVAQISKKRDLHQDYFKFNRATAQSLIDKYSGLSDKKKTNGLKLEQQIFDKKIKVVG